MTIARRLAKLESVLPPAPAVGWTYEEERVFLYELALAVIRAGKCPQLHERLKACADRIAGEIRRTASRPMTDIYRNHISYVEDMWVVSGRTLPFVPPVLGSDNDDWFLPGLTERRIAVRRRPSVIALIGDTVASSSWWHSEFPGRAEQAPSSTATGR
jgi:hypothetical protein